MRMGRRYSRSAGTRSSAGPADGVTDLSGTDRTVSPGPGSDVAPRGARRGRPLPPVGGRHAQRASAARAGAGGQRARLRGPGAPPPPHDKPAPGPTPANAWLAGWRGRARRRAALKYMLVIRKDIRVIS